MAVVGQYRLAHLVKRGTAVEDFGGGEVHSEIVTGKMSDMATHAANSPDDPFERRVRDSFPILDEWRRDAPAEFQPNAGSALAIDDADWPPMPLSQTAYKSFLTAKDHLQAVRVHIDRPVPELFPFAQPSLCRGALIGSSLVVWLLASDDPDVRVRRHRIAVAEELHNHRKYLTDLLGLGEHEDTRKVLEHVEVRLAEMKVKLGIVTRKDWQQVRVSTTAIIESAAMDLGTALVASGESDHDADRLAREVRLEWQSTSGAAHGYTWQIFGGPAVMPASEADEDGRVLYLAGGTFADLANRYAVAFEMSRLAWKLLQARAAG